MFVTPPTKTTFFQISTVVWMLFNMLTFLGSVKYLLSCLQWNLKFASLIYSVILNRMTSYLVIRLIMVSCKHIWSYEKLLIFQYLKLRMVVCLSRQRVHSDDLVLVVFAHKDFNILLGYSFIQLNFNLQHNT